MICLICRQAETLEALTSVMLERGEIKFQINHVPAYRCPDCGEAYVDEDVAARLLQLAEEMARGGVLDGLQEYQSVS